MTRIASAPEIGESPWASPRHQRFVSRAMAGILLIVFLSACFLPFSTGERVSDINWKTEPSATYGYELLFALGRGKSSFSPYSLLCHGTIWTTNICLVSGLFALVIPRYRTAFVLGMAALVLAAITAIFLAPLIGFIRFIASLVGENDRLGLAGPCWLLCLIAVPIVAWRIGDSEET